MTQANLEAIALTSAARTANTTSGDFVNHNYRYLTIFVDVTADSGADVTPRVEMKDLVSDSYTAIWTAAAAISATGEFNYQIGPGLLATASGGYDDTENVVVPRVFRIVMDHNDTTSITYSVAYNLNV